MKRGEIYWVDPVDTEGCVQQFRRPAVIVSNDAANKFSSVIEIVYLTTSKKHRLPTHVPIMSSQIESIALCEQISSVSKSRLYKYVGECTEREMMQINRGLMVSLGIIE